MANPNGNPVYVCTYVRMYVCTYVRMYVCTYVRMYVCTYVRMYVCTYVRMYVCTYVRMYVCTYVRMYVCTYVRMYVCTYVRMYVCTYVRMYVCTYVRMYVCTYVRMYVCTYVRMYVCTYGLSIAYHSCFYIAYFILMTDVIAYVAVLPSKLFVTRIMTFYCRLRCLITELNSRRIYYSCLQVRGCICGGIFDIISQSERTCPTIVTVFFLF